MSEGSWVTLGAHEVEDLETAVEYLRQEGSTSTIGLWGRSMGAVTAILYSQKDPSIAGVVADSPFSKLVDLMMELASNKEQGMNIPKPLVKVCPSEWGVACAPTQCQERDLPLFYFVLLCSLL